MLYPQIDDGFWLIRLLHILLGYVTISIPIILAVCYVRKQDQGGASESYSPWASFLRRFAIGQPEYKLLLNDSATSKHSPGNLTVSRGKSVFDDCMKLLECFIGLQITLISMGYVQERIITQDYLPLQPGGVVKKFENTQFLVFINRLFAIVLSGTYLFFHWKREPVHVPPLYKHSYTSFSNTLSSWCQYEALKYVSFPTQTVCKASKILPTMIMGFIVRGERYDRGDCACAVMLAVGASLFLLANNNKGISDNDNITTLSGACLMFGYLAFDSFTLNWQKALFDTNPRVSKFQMMLGVNLFSMVLCLVTLIEQGTLIEPFKFLFDYHSFARDVFLLSFFGATGQMVIYSTIERFGPVVFAIMMTLRQIFSIILSTIAYGHRMTQWSMLGLVIAFSAIFIKTYRQRRLIRQR